MPDLHLKATALPLIPYLNGFAPGEEIFSENPSRREGHYCPNPLTRSHFKTGVFGGWDGVLSSLSHPKSFQAGRECKGSTLASTGHLKSPSLPPAAQRETPKRKQTVRWFLFSAKTEERLRFNCRWQIWETNVFIRLNIHNSIIWPGYKETVNIQSFSLMNHSNYMRKQMNEADTSLTKSKMEQFKSWTLFIVCQENKPFTDMCGSELIKCDKMDHIWK